MRLVGFWQNRSQSWFQYQGALVSTVLTSLIVFLTNPNTAIALCNFKFSKLYKIQPILPGNGAQLFKLITFYNVSPRQVYVNQTRFSRDNFGVHMRAHHVPSSSSLPTSCVVISWLNQCQGSPKNCPPPLSPLLLGHCPENIFWLPCGITALNVLVFESSDAEKSNLNEMFAVCSVLICLAARVRQAISG